MMIISYATHMVGGGEQVFSRSIEWGRGYVAIGFLTVVFPVA